MLYIFATLLICRKNMEIEYFFEKKLEQIIAPIFVRIDVYILNKKQ